MCGRIDRDRICLPHFEVRIVQRIIGRKSGINNRISKIDQPYGRRREGKSECCSLDRVSGSRVDVHTLVRRRKGDTVDDRSCIHQRTKSDSHDIIRRHNVWTDCARIRVRPHNGRGESRCCRCPGGVHSVIGLAAGKKNDEKTETIRPHKTSLKIQLSWKRLSKFFNPICAVRSDTPMSSKV
jgi:hypothetical protein